MYFCTSTYGCIYICVCVCVCNVFYFIFYFTKVDEEWEIEKIKANKIYFVCAKRDFILYDDCLYVCVCVWIGVHVTIKVYLFIVICMYWCVIISIYWRSNRANENHGHTERAMMDFKNQKQNKRWLQWPRD